MFWGVVSCGWQGYIQNLGIPEILVGRDFFLVTCCNLETRIHFLHITKWICTCNDTLMPGPHMCVTSWYQFPDSKAHVAHMRPTWVLSAPDGPHVGPMNLAIREVTIGCPWQQGQNEWLTFCLCHFKAWNIVQEKKNNVTLTVNAFFGHLWVDSLVIFIPDWLIHENHWQNWNCPFLEIHFKMSST